MVGGRWSVTAEHRPPTTVHRPPFTVHRYQPPTTNFISAALSSSAPLSLTTTVTARPRTVTRSPIAKIAWRSGSALIRSKYAFEKALIRTVRAEASAGFTSVHIPSLETKVCEPARFTAPEAPAYPADIESTAATEVTTRCADAALADSNA